MLLQSHDNDIETEEFRAQLEQDLIYICTLGFTDEIRDGVRGEIEMLRYGKTGDALI